MLAAKFVVSVFCLLGPSIGQETFSTGQQPETPRDNTASDHSETFTTVQQPGTDSSECCSTKVLGGKKYYLKKTNSAEAPAKGCKNSCVYVDYYGKEVCFKNDKNGPQPKCLNEEEPAETCGCKCGVKNNPRNRVYGGKTAGVFEFPWMAALYQNSQYSCGGSLISNRWILTAAHCVCNNKAFNCAGNNKVSEKLLTVGLGVHKMNDFRESNQNDLELFDVDEVVAHPKYFGPTLINDIALLKLARPANLCNYTTICPPMPGNDYTNEMATLIGFGLQEVNSGREAYLQELNVTMLEAKECFNRLVQLGGTSLAISLFKNHQNSLCDNEAQGEGGCKGDSGGPLMWMKDADQYAQAGLVSWGPTSYNKELQRFECGKGAPAVYTRVDQYLDWINLVIRGSSKCSM